MRNGKRDTDVKNRLLDSVGEGKASSRKTSTSASLTDQLVKAKAFDFVDHNKLWKILKEMAISDHLICLLRNLYACLECWAG